MNAHTVISKLLLLVLVLLCGETVSISQAQAQICVSTSKQFQDALDSASDGGANSGTDVRILLTKGTFKIGAATSNGPFKFHSTSTTSQIVLVGGFDPTCTTSSNNAADTIVDGNNSSQVLNLISKSGSISLYGLTIQNGNTDQQGGGLSINASPNTGTNVSIFDCIIRNNHSSANGGGIAAYSVGTSTASFDFVSNAVYGNSSDTTYGAGLLAFNGDVISVFNNTVYGNTATANNAVGGLGCCGSASFAVQVTANIFWQNTNYGIDLYGSPVSFEYNDYGTLSGNVPSDDFGSLTVDPKFVNAAAGDLRLGQGSPLIGYVPMNGSFGDTDDVEGYSRNAGAPSDPGAYAETIFADQFGGFGN